MADDNVADIEKVERKKLLLATSLGPISQLGYD